MIWYTCVVGIDAFLVGFIFLVVKASLYVEKKQGTIQKYKGAEAGLGGDHLYR